MNTHQYEVPTTRDPLAHLYPTSQAELDALDKMQQQYQDGLLTLSEAMRMMEGKQDWQRCSQHSSNGCDGLIQGL